MTFLTLPTRCVVFTTLAVAALSTAHSTGGASQQTLTEAEQAAVESAVREEMARLRAPGVSLAIVRAGAIAWSGGFGQANLERSVQQLVPLVQRIRTATSLD